MKCSSATWTGVRPARSRLHRVFLRNGPSPLPYRSCRTRSDRPGWGVIGSSHWCRATDALGSPGAAAAASRRRPQYAYRLLRHPTRRPGSCAAPAPPRPPRRPPPPRSQHRGRIAGQEFRIAANSSSVCWPEGNHLIDRFLPLSLRAPDGRTLCGGGKYRRFLRSPRPEPRLPVRLTERPREHATAAQTT
jgi:hypothetical protein